MSSIPKYFVIENGSSYQLYLNTVYSSSDTSYTNINVIWPIVNLRARNLTVKRARDMTETLGYTRKWNSTDYMMCEWNMKGSSIEVYLVDSSIYVTAPVINISDTDCLPFNPTEFSPIERNSINDWDTTSYMPAVKYSTDPSNDQNTTPIRRENVPVARPVARPVALATPVARPVATQAPVAILNKGLPTHITKLVLDDAISKNEVCPITSEPITQTNATVTNCGHVFSSSGLTTWLKTPSSKGLCPTCRTSCV